MNRNDGMVSFDLKEASTLYVRLKNQEDTLDQPERSVLRKLEGFVYDSLSIAEAENLLTDKRNAR
ncbi:MAG: hypothetical protein A2Z99_16030 [Treponema sp. GWB1_62_6]|nr:MAG: hypothetical protein A2Y36_13685 [Treponema sp. GWA1_62_8]OHE65071.1 MAG: hypothetical protein A2001_17875 [Treponema sp. GWC1_61_84]OHE65183.1 MAG: hypothetical protein A2Z99_16030 [Treponema sp. GWB1_62_6]HCM26057.1 hypothetical protein [Treponema sp.]